MSEQGIYPSCVEEAYKIFIRKILPPVKKSHEDVRVFVSKLLDCLGLTIDEQSHEVRVKHGRVDILIPGRFVIELKTDLQDGFQYNDGIRKLVKYAADTGATLGILTDGHRWELFYILRDGSMVKYASLELVRDMDEFYRTVVEELRPFLVRSIKGIEPSRDRIDRILRDIGINSQLYFDVRNTLADIIRGNPRIPNLIRIWVKIYSRLYPGLNIVTRTLGIDLRKDVIAREKYEPIAKYLVNTNSVNSLDEGLGVIELFLRHMYYDLLLRTIATIVLTPDKMDIRSAKQLLGLWSTGTELTSIFKYSTIYMEAWEQAVRWSQPLVDEIIRKIMSIIASYDWTRAEPDVFRELYENLLPQDLRHQIGEYYTPDQVIEATLKLVESAYLDAGTEFAWLDKYVVDPACGSGGFLVAVLNRKFEELKKSLDKENKLPINEVLIRIARLVSTVVGFDINPIAVTTTRLLILLTVIKFIRELGIGVIPILDIQVYLADSLSPISLIELGSSSLYFTGKSVVLLPKQGLKDENYDMFVSYVAKISEYVAKLFEKGNKEIKICAKKVDEVLSKSLSVNKIDLTLLKPYYDKLNNLVSELRKSIKPIIKTTWEYALWTVLLNLPNIRELGDGVWGIIIKSIILPLKYKKMFDIVVGNPPWLRYNMAGDLQWLYDKVWQMYEIAPKPHLRTSYDLAVIFYVASANTYLKDEGVIAYVMPRSVIDGEQHFTFLKKLVDGELDGLRAYAILELDIDPRTKERIRRTFKHGIPAIVLVSTRGLKPKRTHYAVLR